MSLSVSLETDIPFSQRLPERQRLKMVSDRMNTLRALFVLSVGRVLQTSLPLVAFGEMALQRWPILSTPGQLQKVFIESIRLSSGGTANEGHSVGVELDVGAAAKRGLTRELVWALEYGHPDGVPALAVWRRASSDVERQAQQTLRKLGDDASKRLSQSGGKRYVRVA